MDEFAEDCGECGECGLQEVEGRGEDGEEGRRERRRRRGRLEEDRRKKGEEWNIKTHQTSAWLIGKRDFRRLN